MDGAQAIVSERHRLPLALMLRASLAHLWSRLRWFVTAVFVGGVVFLVLGLLGGQTAYMIIGGVLAVYGAGCLPMTAWRTTLRRMRISRIERIVRLSDDGVETIGVGDEPTVFVWEAFAYARRGNGFWLLYLKNGLFATLPDLAFRAEDREALAVMLGERMPVRR